MSVEQPYTVTEYRIIDRKAEPPTVAQATAPTRHRTESAGRRAAKNRVDGGLNNGPQNICVLEGPGIREVWFCGSRSSHHGRMVTISVTPKLYLGAFTILPTEAPCAPF